MFKYIFSLTVIVSLTIGATAFAQEVDAAQYLNAALAKKSALKVTQHLTRSVSVRECPEDKHNGMTCYWTHEQQPYDQVGTVLASVEETRVVEVKKFAFSAQKIASFPLQINESHKNYENCANLHFTRQDSAVITTLSGWRITRTAGVRTTHGGAVSGNLSIPDFGGTNFSLSWSHEITTSQSNEDNHSETITRSWSDTFAIEPYQAVAVGIMTYTFDADAPFSAVVVIDGDLPANLSGVTKASQLLSEEERTLPLTGVVHVSDVSAATMRADDLSGEFGCKNRPGVRISDYSAESHRVKAPVKGYVPQSRLVRDSEKRVVAQRYKKSGQKDAQIGPADGTSYEVLYTTQVISPAIGQCGFNDIGVPISGIFDREARLYKTYANGTLVSQETRFEETFVSCWNP